jgi:hypothetical protein
MSRINAETLSLEGIRKETGFSFCDLIDVGPAEGECNSLPQISRIPAPMTGVYIVWVAIGDRSPIAVYGGKSAAKSEGIRHRIRVEFNYKENARTQQGPFRVNQYLKALDQPHSFYITYAEFGTGLEKRPREHLVDSRERHMLDKIDFIANDALNGERRLEALDAFCGAATAEPTCPPVPVEVAVATAAAPAADAATDLAAENAALRARLAAADAREARHQELVAAYKMIKAKLAHLEKEPTLFVSEIEEGRKAESCLLSRILAC